MPNLATRLGRFLGFAGGGNDGTDVGYSSYLGFGKEWEGLGQVPDWVKVQAEALRTIGQDSICAQVAETESRQAGEMQAKAGIMKALVKARRQKLQALASMAGSQIQLDQAAFQAASQVANTQAQALGQMAQMDFQNRMVGANLGGKVSAYRESENVFNL